MGCKGTCIRYKADKPSSKSRYADGQVWCRDCEMYMKPPTHIAIHGMLVQRDPRLAKFCVCCGNRVRNKPRNSALKAKQNMRIEILYV